MTSKKETVPLVPTPTLQRELKRLYARRSAIDNLIEALEDYDRCRSKAAVKGGRKTA